MKISKIIGGFILASLVAGCSSENSETDPTVSGDPGTETATGVWSEKAPTPTARSGFRNVAINGKVYVMGGFSGGSRLGLVEEFDTSTQTWTNCGMPAPDNGCASMITARSGFGATVVDGIIYIFGGRSEPTTWINVVEAYDPANNIWTAKADMPTTRDGIGVVAIGTEIYLIGGTVFAALDDIEVYDTLADSWSVKSPIPTEYVAADFAVSYLNGKIYLTGGYDYDASLISTKYLKKVVEYDPVTEEWVSKAPMKTARSGHASLTLANKIYVFSGESSYCDATNIVEVYDADKNNWLLETEIPGTVGGCDDIAVAGSNGKAYIASGSFFGNANFAEFTP